MSTTEGSQQNESTSDDNEGMETELDSEDNETDFNSGTDSSPPDTLTSMPGPYSFEPMISDSESLPDGDSSTDGEERLLDLSW